MFTSNNDSGTVCVKIAKGLLIASVATAGAVSLAACSDKGDSEMTPSETMSPTMNMEKMEGDKMEGSGTMSTDKMDSEKMDGSGTMSSEMMPSEKMEK